VLEVIKADGSTPIFTVGGAEIPLFGKAGLPVWALLNFVLGMLGAVLALITGLVARYNRKDEELRKDEGINEQAKRMRTAALVVIGAAVAAAILFFLTQDMTNLMVLVDIWTVAHAILMVVIIIGMIVVMRNRKPAKVRQQEFELGYMPASME